MNRILILLASLLVVGNVYGSAWQLSSGIGWDSFDFVTYRAECGQAGCVLVVILQVALVMIWEGSRELIVLAQT